MSIYGRVDRDQQLSLQGQFSSSPTRFLFSLEGVRLVSEAVLCTTVPKTAHSQIFVANYIYSKMGVWLIARSNGAMAAVRHLLHPDLLEVRRSNPTLLFNKSPRCRTRTLNPWRHCGWQTLDSYSSPMIPEMSN
jgi:hypothetical protein